MSISIRKLGVLALVGAMLLVFGMLRPGAPSQTTEAAFQSPGGIQALPSYFPGLPDVANQAVPAMIPASAPGNQALITVWADPNSTGILGADTFPDEGSIFDSDCNITAAGTYDLLASVCFKVQAIDPTTGALGPTAAVFDNSGSDRLLCDSTAGCNLDTNKNNAVIAVLLDGGGKDEYLKVTATDESGNTRTVNVITVQTMIALPPIVEPTATAFAPGPTGTSIVGYRCNTVGKSVDMVPPRAWVWHRDNG